MISGIIAGLAASKYVSDTLTTISHINKTSKFISKVVYPLGIFAISSAVGNAAGKAVQDEIDSMKDTIAGVKEIGKAMREAKEAEVKEEPETHNVFEGQSGEVDENGES